MPIDSIEYLDLAQDILKSFVPPATSFDPNNAWSHRYKILTMVSGTGVRPTNRVGGTLKIERLPRRESPALRFTLFDPCDVPKPNQVLSFYKTAQLAGRWAGAPSLLVHGFLQTGDGVSPQVYWVDEKGRLLFLIAGIDAYVLE